MRGGDVQGGVGSRIVQQLPRRHILRGGGCNFVIDLLSMPRRHLLYRGGCCCLHKLRQLPCWSGSQRLCRFFCWSLRGVLWLSSRRKPHRVHRQRCWSLRGVCARQVQDNCVGHSSVRAMRGCSFVPFWVVSQWMRGGIRRHLLRLRRVSCGGVSCGVRASRIRAMHHVRAWVLQG